MNYPPSSEHKALLRKWIALFIGRLIAGVALVYLMTAYIIFDWSPAGWPGWAIGVSCILAGTWLVGCSWLHYIFFAIDGELLD